MSDRQLQEYQVVGCTGLTKELSSSLFLSWKPRSSARDCHSVLSPFEAISTFAKDFDLTFIETSFKNTEFLMETFDKRRCPKLNKCPGLLLGSLLFFISSLGLSTSKEYSESGFRIYSNRQSFIYSLMELSICINPSLHQIAEHLPSTTLFWKVVFPFDFCFY